MINLKNGKEELNKVLSENKKCIVDFHTVWCGPCKMLTPELEKLEAKHPDWVVVRIDAEKFPDIFAETGSSAVPTICIFKDQKIQEITAGYRPVSELEKIISKY